MQQYVMHRIAPTVIAIISASYLLKKLLLLVGLIYIQHLLQKNMGKSLIKAGFYEVYGEPVAGDVAVISSIPGHPDGHVCIYDGQKWISDFRQRSLYPGDSYRRAHPAFKLYRHY
ncbi:CHAP domain-containing protein [Cronobacter turicensis]